MFISRIILFALPAFVAATAVPRAGGNQNKGNKNTNTGGNNSCSQGTTQFCCNNVQSANALSADNKWLLGMLGVNTDNLVGQIGLSCNPVVASSSGCNAQSVCCQNSQGSGGVAANNCSPTIVNA
ncbi:hypothetical protein M378DRAFT_805173 [Amanita muscaria Koide BX008]|uniref:Hydrophobin n=1 Tax=Amanita muscaria (strain Koide BX008) TaxID=946122 RepID=A0A0C2T6B0_AMAMK|nr:hypothetical protein M378DRAFT_805173 [Amanita muscaria Koide BX008]